MIDRKTGKKLPARSTRTRNHDEALLVIADWLVNGIKNRKDFAPRPLETFCDVKGIIKAIRKTELAPDDAMRIVKTLTDLSLIDILAVPRGNGSICFISYLLDFWNYDTSEYLKERISHGYSLTKRHCHECANYTRLHWELFFKDRKLNTVTLQDLKDFSQTLYDKGLASGTINHILNVGKKALKEAYRKQLIPFDSTDGLAYFSGKTKKRGVLTPEEAARLFSLEWGDKRAYAGKSFGHYHGITEWRSAGGT
ncbi:MAG: hypothetical protein LBG84_09260 [Treponema sp.]|nr:hypothetical protein [Treponema sp.]